MVHLSLNHGPNNTLKILNSKMSSKMVINILILQQLSLLFSLVQISNSQRGTVYPLLFQPEIDSLDIGIYFRNERLVKLQIMCIFYGGPCDIAGRWLKRKSQKYVKFVCVKIKLNFSKQQG